MPTGRAEPTNDPGGVVKHCATNVLYSRQHLGFVIPPQADAAWIGEIGPGPGYGDTLPDGTRVGLDNDFTNRNVTFVTWNRMHLARMHLARMLLARMLQDAGGVPAFGNQRSEWERGARFDFMNPEYCCAPHLVPRRSVAQRRRVRKVVPGARPRRRCRRPSRCRP
jgi:hypothetical protein